MTILIVEDDLSYLRLVQDELEREGYTIIPCDDGRQAVRILKSVRIDMIVSDVNLPYIGGFELFKIVKSQFPKTEFILYTSTDSPDLQKLADRMGVTKFFMNAGRNLSAIKNAAIERLRTAVDANTDVTKRILDA